MAEPIEGSSLQENAAQERMMHPKRNAAIVLFQREDKRVLLVRTHRLPGSWQPVGGGVEPEDATPEDTAIREVQEELGLVLRPAQLHHVVDLPYDFGEGTIHCFLAEWSKADTEVKTVEEFAEIGWFTLEEARRLPAFDASKRFLETVHTLQGG